MKYDRTRRTAIIAGAITVGIIAITLLIIHLAKPRQHTLDVKLIQWQYTIQIQEYRTVHECGWIIPSEGAYNVWIESRQNGVQTIYVDNDTTIQVPKYDTWYEYDIDKWCNSRTIITTGTDKLVLY